MTDHPETVTITVPWEAAKAMAGSFGGNHTFDLFIEACREATTPKPRFAPDPVAWLTDDGNPHTPAQHFNPISFCAHPQNCTPLYAKEATKPKPKPRFVVYGGIGRWLIRDTGTGSEVATFRQATFTEDAVQAIADKLNEGEK